MNTLPCLEVILSSDTSQHMWNCSVWDPSSRSTLTTFRGGNSIPRTLATIGKDYVISALADKPILKTWTWSKANREETQMSVPGVVTALAVTPRGSHCIAAIKTKLYIWHVSSGELLTIIGLHFTTVNCLKFSDDGNYVVSAGDDGLVMAWHFIEILGNCEAAYNDEVKPLYEWYDHASPVTDVHVGHGGFRAKVITSSADRSCRIYSLATGKILFSVYADVPLDSVHLDHAEYFLSVGASNGLIYQLKFYNCLQQESINLSEEKEVFEGHKNAVTCLSSSLDGNYLLSGSKDSCIKIWHVLNRICLSTFNHLGPVTNAFFVLAPPALMSTEKFEPNIILKPFKHDVQDFSPEESITIKCESQLPTTFQLEYCDEAFYRTVAKQSSQEAARGKTVLQKDLNYIHNVNEQMYSFSLGTFLNGVGSDFVLK